MLKLTLPIPPSTNHSHHEISTKNGRRMRVPSKATKDWTKFARDAAESAMRDQQFPYITDEKVILRYWVFWPDKRKRDCANLLKVALDALEGVVYNNDRYVLPRAIDYSSDKGDARIELEIERA